MTPIDPNLLATAATVITAYVALFVYTNQKRDLKENAARVLLLEIRTAEERIQQIRDKITAGNASDFPSVFPTNSWKTYSHLFVKDFDQDELKLVSSFYDYGSLVDEFAKRDNNFFWVTTEEKARVHQQKLGEIIMEASKMDAVAANQYVQTKRDFLVAEFNKHPVSYTPAKTTNEIQAYLGRIQMITTTPCGSKLKKIAKLP